MNWYFYKNDIYSGLLGIIILKYVNVIICKEKLHDFKISNNPCRLRNNHRFFKQRYTFIHPTNNIFIKKWIIYNSHKSHHRYPIKKDKNRFRISQKFPLRQKNNHSLHSTLSPRPLNPRFPSQLHSQRKLQFSYIYIKQPIHSRLKSQRLASSSPKRHREKNSFALFGIPARLRSIVPSR